MDRVTVAITRYVIAKMGEKYVQPPTLDYSAIYRQSTQMTPIVFVLSPGADPAFDVFKLGEPLALKFCIWTQPPFSKRALRPDLPTIEGPFWHGAEAEVAMVYV